MLVASPPRRSPLLPGQLLLGQLLPGRSLLGRCQVCSISPEVLHHHRRRPTPRYRPHRRHRPLPLLGQLLLERPLLGRPLLGRPLPHSRGSISPGVQHRHHRLPPASMQLRCEPHTRLPPFWLQSSSHAYSPSPELLPRCHRDPPPSKRDPERRHPERRVVLPHRASA